MSLLKFTSFGGEVPRLTKRDLPDDSARVAENLFADTKEFRPMRKDGEPLEIGLAGEGDVMRTIYRYPTGSAGIVGSSQYLVGTRSTIPNDTYDRVYASSLSSEPVAPAPMVLQSGKDYPDAALRPLGVSFPVLPLTLAQATIEDAVLTPNEVTEFKGSIVEAIQKIVLSATETYLWNNAFDLDSRDGFREDAAQPGSGWWQRYITDSTPTGAPTWNTYNGVDIARMMWATVVTNPPFIDEIGGARTYYASFPAKVWVRRLKADITDYEDELKDLVVPNTTDRILSDAEIDAIFASVRAVLPDDPATNTNTDFLAIMNRLGVNYTKLVNYLEFGFDTNVSPQAGYQLIVQALTEVLNGTDALSTYYERLSNVALPDAILEYFRQSRVLGVVPEGQISQIEVRYYTYTLVNPYGEESKPYLPGDGNENDEIPVLECNQAQTATITLPANVITHISAVELGTNPTTTWKWRVYRSAGTTDSAAFFLVTEVPLSTTSFTDLRRSESLNESCRTMTWFPPPVHGSGESARCLRHVIQMPGDYLAGFIDNTVYFSEPGHPYAWPPQYALPLNDDIVGHGVFGATLVVLTKGRPVYISGTAPETVSRDELESIETCQSPSSIVPVTGGVAFASQNGLCIATQQGIVNMTSSLYTRAEWEALTPSGMLCAEMDGVVYFTQPGLSRTGALHVGSGKLVRMDLDPTAFYSDHSTGRLYAALEPADEETVAKAVLVQDAVTVRTAKWRSKRIVLAKETGFAWLAVEGEHSVANPLYVDVYAYYVDPDTGNEHIDLLETEVGDGVYSAVVVDTRPVRITTGRYKDFEVEIKGKCRITSVALASSTAELQGVN